MLQKTKLLFLLIVASAAIMGFYQISSNNDVFIKSTALCCEQGMCHDAECQWTSTMSTSSSNCEGYTSNCYECIDQIAGENVCGYTGPYPTWCRYFDGQWKYYAPGMGCESCHGQ